MKENVSGCFFSEHSVLIATGTDSDSTNCTRFSYCLTYRYNSL